jgi:hypothetical protein
MRTIARHSLNASAPVCPAKSWRDVLSVHPAAELFPRMSRDELRALGEDIIVGGLTNNIALWQADSKSPLQLLDGINRLDAIELETGCPVEVGASSLMAGKFLACDKVIVLDGKKVDPYAYVISANIHRRHLTAKQKGELIEKLLKATPERSDRQIATITKVDHKTVGSVRSDMEGRGEIPHVSTRTDTKGRKQQAKKIATTLARHADVLRENEAWRGKYREDQGHVARSGG